MNQPGCQVCLQTVRLWRGYVMKTRYFLTIVILIFISGFSYVEGNETLEFDLTEKKINKAFVNDCSEGNYAVTVELKEPYKTYFSKLTEKNIGKKLAITFCGRTLISPIIRSKIASGTIEVDKWNSEINAKQFQYLRQFAFWSIFAKNYFLNINKINML